MRVLVFYIPACCIPSNLFPRLNTGYPLSRVFSVHPNALHLNHCPVFRFKHIVVYGCSLAALLLLLQLMEYKFMVLDHATEIYVTGVALLFTLLGIWLAAKLVKPKTEVRTETVLVEKEVVVYRDGGDTFTGDDVIVQQLGISQREMEVLQLMAQGYSNQEIAEKLFLSLNTIKTHSSKLFEKLDVKRRTQAIEKAKRLKIIP